MEIVLAAVAFLFLLLGLLGSVVPALPGPPLSFIGLLLLKWSGYGNFSTVFLLLWGAIMAAVTVMDYILPALMTKRFGGSRAAVLRLSFGAYSGDVVFRPDGTVDRAVSGRACRRVD